MDDQVTHFPHSAPTTGPLGRVAGHRQGRRIGIGDADRHPDVPQTVQIVDVVADVGNRGRVESPLTQNRAEGLPLRVTQALNTLEPQLRGTRRHHRVGLGGEDETADTDP